MKNIIIFLCLCTICMCRLHAADSSRADSLLLKLDQAIKERPIMAKESARLSDRVIITSDNPRFEEPQDIINDMLAGLDKDDMQKTISITDRREAIKTACMLAQPGDVILVAGKGHENYQEIKGVKHHFDDKEILNEIMC